MILGVALFGAIWVLLLISPLRLHRWPWFLLLALITFVVFVVQLMALVHEVAPLRIAPPHFSLTQASRFMDSVGQSDPIHAIRLDSEKATNDAGWKRDWKTVGLNVLPEPYVPGMSPEPGVAIFVGIAEPVLTPGASWTADAAHNAELHHTTRLQQATDNLAAAGYRVETLDAGVLGIPVDKTAADQ